MLISLLDLLGAQKGAAPGGNGLLARVVQKKRDEEAAGQPPQRRAPVQFPVGQGQPQGLPSPESVPQGDMDALRQQNRAILGQTIMGVTGQGLTPAQRTFTDEVAEAEMNNGPGRRGRTLLAKVVVGDRVPGFSEAQQRRLDSRTLVTAGLMTLASNRSGLGGIAEGILYGQAHAAGMMQGMLEAAQTQGELIDQQEAAAWVQDAYATVNEAHPEWTELEKFRFIGRRADAEGRLVEAGNVEQVVKRQKNFESELAEAKESKDFPGLFVRGDQFFDADGERVSREQIDALREQQQQQPQGERFVRQSVPGRGIVEFELDPQTGQVVGQRTVAGIPAEPDDSESPTTAQIEARSAADRIRSEMETIEETLDSVADIGDTLKPGMFKSEDRQRFEAAGNNLAAVVTRALFGAAATEEEFKRVKRDNIPQFGDKPQTIENKLERIRQLIVQSEAVAAGQFPDQQDDDEPAESPGAAQFFDAFDAGS